MAATRIEVRSRKLANGKIEVIATADGQEIMRKVCKEPGEAREKFGISHGQKGHDVYSAKFAANYYVADLLDESEEKPAGVGMPRRARKRRR